LCRFRPPLLAQRLFVLDPTVRPMFKGDMREQGQKLMGTSINSDFVIPAKAGIQSNQATGFRVKPGMTIYRSALMKMLGLIVNSLTWLDELVPAAQGLARKHVDYGVKPAHYDTVGAALLWTLEQGLGSKFTNDVKAAWATTCGTLSQVMKDAAYAPA